MTRNHDKSAQLRDAIGPPSREQTYSLGGFARAMLATLNAPPIDWARTMHELWGKGYFAPRKGESELRFKSLVRTVRILSASANEDDQKKAGELSRFVSGVWGVTKAAVAIGGDDRDLVHELREKWGDAQLPPEGAMVGPWSADYLLVEAAVRRLG